MPLLRRSLRSLRPKHTARLQPTTHGRVCSSQHTAHLSQHAGASAAHGTRRVCLSTHQKHAPCPRAAMGLTPVPSLGSHIQQNEAFRVHVSNSKSFSHSDFPGVPFIFVENLSLKSEAGETQVSNFPQAPAHSKFHCTQAPRSGSKGERSRRRRLGGKKRKKGRLFTIDVRNNPGQLP